MPRVLLSCADPLQPRRPDPHFAAELAAARDLGAVTGLIDHDALLAGRCGDALARVPRDAGPAWYRGWMIPAPRYRELAEALEQRGTPLLTGADAYQRAHELPGWYPTFAEVTPATRWMPISSGDRSYGGPECADSRSAGRESGGSASAPSVPSEQRLVDLARPLGPGPGIVKDYVKSAKHLWDTACYIPDLCDAAALHRTVTAFVAEQAEFLTGGIVLRAFEEFEHAGSGSEVRVWWLDGEAVLVGAHPDAGAGVGSGASAGADDEARPDLAPFGRLVAALGTRFVTTDLNRRRDGVWRLIEVGDGQVSDLPRAVEPAGLIGALLAAGV